MSEAPERILVESECGHANAYNSEDRRTWLHFPDNAQGYFYAEYVRADRIEELEAKLAKADKLASEFKNCLEVLTKEDGYVCCSGHQCGCYGASLHAQAIYYANEAIDDYHKTTGGKDE